MRAAILSIGSELLHGILTDTNATFFAQELTALGFDVVSIAQVGDDQTNIVRALTRALGDSDLLITTGGIGPTADDLTREAIAEVCGESPAVDDELLRNLRAHFAARGSEMPERNIKQAWLIPSAQSIPNPYGSAPGWYTQYDGKHIVTLPGPPRENVPLWRQHVMPIVLPKLTGQAIISRTLKTIGIGESSAEQEIQAIVEREFPRTATYAKSDGVHIRVTAADPDRNVAQRAVDETVDEIRAQLGQYIYGELGDSLAYAILQPLATVGVRLAVWEAGTAGAFLNLLQTDDRVAGIVSDARSSTFEFARLEVGAEENPVCVALACARAAAGNAGINTATSLAVNVTGDDQAERRFGEIGMALVHPGGEVTRDRQISATPPEIRRRATLWTAEFLWSSIRDATGIRQD